MNDINTYWPVYKDIEVNFDKLMYSIHISDDQLYVYSTQISDLILRSAIEIESIAKELYKDNGGTKTGNLKYDEDAIQHLNRRWNLENKIVIISSSKCYLTKRTLKPFLKNAKKTDTERMTYSWNNAYQNLKHNRGNSLHFGNIKNLFEILAALYILNIYYKNETFKLEKDYNANSFQPNLGSNIFSIQLSKNKGYSSTGEYMKEKNFDESIYITKWIDKSINEFMGFKNKSSKKLKELIIANSNFQNYVNKNGIDNLNASMIESIIGRQDFWNMLNEADNFADLNILKNFRYEAILNKNGI